MERVHLHLEFGKRPLRRWRNGASAGSGLRFVSVGQLADGRWWANCTGQAEGAYVFGADERGERLARDTAARLMDDGAQWVPTPAVFGPDGVPTDGLSWVRRGGEWFPGEDQGAGAGLEEPGER